MFYGVDKYAHGYNILLPLNNYIIQFIEQIDLVLKQRRWKEGWGGAGGDGPDLVRVIGGRCRHICPEI